MFRFYSFRPQVSRLFLQQITTNSLLIFHTHSAAIVCEITSSVFHEASGSSSLPCQRTILLSIENWSPISLAGSSIICDGEQNAASTSCFSSIFNAHQCLALFRPPLIATDK